jgi:putative PIN family toxin of toxin-antitoxin system
MRVVLDTNVLVSALIVKVGKPAQILDRIARFVLFTTEESLAEVERVLGYQRIKRRYNISDKGITDYIKRRRTVVSKTKVRSDWQVRIPADIATRYDLREGDTLDIHDIGGGIIFIPGKIKSKKLLKELNKFLLDKMEDYLELQDPELKKQIKEGYEAYKRGETRDGRELLAELKKEPKKEK